MNTILEVLDPETYGLNRAAVVLGLGAAATLVLMGVKLLAVLRGLGLSGP